MIKLPLDWEIYIEKHSSPLLEILDEIERQTYLRTTFPQMLSGKIQAGFLHFLVKLLRPDRILEIGTFTGYATIAMASALPDHAVLDTIEADETTAAMASEFFKQSPWKNKIKLHLENAEQFLRHTSLKYDFVFLDADKENYPKYYRLIKPLLNPGGLWITDNVLWSGKVLNPGDGQAQAIDRFNKLVNEDSGLENYLLPIRDGLMLIKHKD